MLFLLSLIFYCALSQPESTCDERLCPKWFIGNNNCNKDCMTPKCNFDSKLYSSDKYLSFQSSDCFSKCSCNHQKLANGICDSECNIYQCGYDLGDCFYCAPKCEVTFLGNLKCEKMCNNFECNYDNQDCNCNNGCFDTSGECLTTKDFTDPCDTVYCEYKDGKCGYCASGCFENHLGDGICQPECNTNSCNFDNGDCGCAPRCSFKYDLNLNKYIQTGTSENCSKYCLVLGCHFGVDFCTNTTSIKTAVLNYIIFKDDFRISYFQFCRCTVEMINIYLDQESSCTENSICNNEYCLYCLGQANKTFDNCLRQSFEKCLICYSIMVDDVCYKDLSECPAGYENISKLSDLFGVRTWCLKKAVYYSKSYYSDNYVNSSVLSNGNGIKENPFKTFYSALVNVNAAYTKIYLIDKEINFFIDESRSIFVVDLYDPLNTKDKFKIYELWIIGNYSETEKTVIYWKDNLKLSPQSQKFYIKNIEFNGKYVLDNLCVYRTCFYCPYVNIQMGFIHDDKGNLIDRYYYAFEYSKNCSSYGTINVLNFLSNETFIENVNFADFRYQYNSFIKSSSVLTLKNVNFFKMQAKSTGAIILLECINPCLSDMTCDNPCYNSVFSYNQGLVVDIGEGYHDSLNVATGSFLMGSSIGDIKITNVSFSYNFVFNNLRSTDKGYLIYIRNHLGTIFIEACTFSNNYANYLVYIDVSSLVYTDYKTKKGIGQVFSQQHFYMNNIQISNTYCSHGMLYYIMLDVVHNINVTNVLVDKSVMGPSGIFSFINEGTLKNSDINGDYFIKVVKDFFNKPINFYIYLEARFLKIENLIIKNSQIGKNSLHIENLPNISIKNISIHNISDGTQDDIKIIINSFKENDIERYFSYIDTETELPLLDCNEMVSISDCINIQIDFMGISGIKCQKKELPLGLHLSKISGITQINSLFLAHMENSAKSGNGLNAIDCNSITLTDLKILNVSNLMESIVSFDFCNQVVIDSATISQVKSKYASTFIVSNLRNFGLSNFIFNDVSSEFDNGGCLCLITGMLEFSFKIESGIFSGCSSKNSKGGAVFLDSVTRVISTSFQFNDLRFSKCFSYEGSAIYISNSIILSNVENSEISRLLIEDNDCIGGGIISDYHYSGTLKIDQMKLVNNRRGLYVFYSNSYPTLFITNTIIYASDTLISLIYLNSLALGTSVSFDNVELFFAKKLAIEASSIKISINKMNISDSSQAIYFSDQVECEANELLITNNKEKGITLAQNTSFTCVSCEFRKNNNSIIDASSDSNFSLINSKIYSNFLEHGNLISIASGNKEKSTLINCQIYSNTLITGNLVYLFLSILNVTDCLIIKNHAYSTNVQAFYSFNSILNINSSRLQMNGLVSFGAFLYAVAESEITAENTLFENSASIVGNIYGNNAKIAIKNCKFLSNTGGDIYTTTCILIITNSIFENSMLTNSNLGAITLVNNDATSIENSFFSNVLTMENLNSLAYVYDESGKILNISGCNLAGSSNYIMAVFLIETFSVSIMNSNFTRFYTDEYSALTMISKKIGCSLTLIGSRIIENWSESNGGGLYSESYSLIIENTEISFNRAQDSGGGIYFVSTYCDNCGFYVSGATRIFNNSCSNDGGGIKWKDFKPFIENPDLIFNNSALYGADFASTPSKFGLFKGRSLSDTIITTISNVAPGKIFTNVIQISIYDTYGQVIKTENSLLASLLVNETTDSFTAISGITSFKAKNGVFNITDFILTGKPGSSVFLKFKSENQKLVSYKNYNSEYLDSAFIKVDFRNCTNGEQIQAIACVDCSEGRYTLKASENCFECPTGAFCTGGSAIIVNNGFWRSSLESDVIYTCHAPDACLKGDKTNELGKCGKGYSKALCKSCEIGYSKTANGICRECPDRKTNFVTTVFLCLGISFISFIMVKTTLTSAFSPKSLHSIYIKIFTNYLQLIFIVTQFELDWPNYLTEFFNFQRTTGSVFDQLFSLDCILVLRDSGDVENIYYSKLLIISGLPIFIVSISYIYWIFHASLIESYKSLKREAFTTIIVLFFLVYPTIVKFMFSNFSCIKIDKMSSYLNENTSIECWDLSHKQYSFIIVIPSIILWAIGVPIILLLLMKKNKRRLHLDHYRVVYGFLYNGYKQSRFYWEVNIMLRKILLIAITVFKISQANTLQALNFFLLMLVSIYLHYYFRPYNSNQLNSMEMQALNIAAITIYFGLYYMSNTIGEQVKILLFVFIVIGNSFFVIYWIYYMTQALIGIFIKFFPNFRSFFNRGDAFEEEFYREEILREGVYMNRLDMKKAYTFINLQNIPKEDDLKFKSIDDVYIEVAKRDIEKMNEINE